MVASMDSGFKIPSIHEILALLLKMPTGGLRTVLNDEMENKLIQKDPKKRNHSFQE